MLLRLNIYHVFFIEENLANKWPLHAQIYLEEMAWNEGRSAFHLHLVLLCCIASSTFFQYFPQIQLFCSRDYLNWNLTFCDTYFAFLLHLFPAPLAVPLFTLLSSCGIMEYLDFQLLPRSLMNLLALSVMVECKCLHTGFLSSDSALFLSVILLALLSFTYFLNEWLIFLFLLVFFQAARGKSYVLSSVLLLFPGLAVWF